MSRRPRNTGTVRRRGPDTWQLLYKREGVQFSRTIHVGTKRDALAALPDFVHAVRSGDVEAARAERTRGKVVSPTFEEACRDFIEELSSDPLDSTRLTYSNSLLLLGRNGLNGLKIQDVRQAHVREALLAINRKCAIATVRLAHMTLGRLFKSLIAGEKLTANPVPVLSALKLPAAGKATKERGALTPEQVHALLDAANGDDQLHLWVQLMLATACRPGEAAAIRFGSIDWNRGMLKIDSSVKPSAVRGQGRLGQTKGRRSRVVPLGPAIMRALERAYLQRGDMYRRVGLTQEDSDFLFPADIVGDGRHAPRNVGALKKKFDIAAQRAGLKGVTPHWLRHTALTRALAGDALRPGVSVADAAAFAGHRDATMISRVYGHAISENVARGAVLADALLLPAPTAEVVDLATRKAVSQVTR